MNIDLLNISVPLYPWTVPLKITVSTKGRVVIPSSLRRKLGVKPGTRIQVELDENNAQIILTPITREYIHSRRGRFCGKGLLKELLAEKVIEGHRDSKA